MIDVTVRIKNLSIALEAISHINNEGSANLYVSIEAALQDEIQNHTKETDKYRSTPTSIDDDTSIF